MDWYIELAMQLVAVFAFASSLEQSYQVVMHYLDCVETRLRLEN